MRTFCIAMLLLGACAKEPTIDGDQNAMEVALDSDVALPESESAATEEDAPRAGPPDGTVEQTQQTLDCPVSGTVRVSIRREFADDPLKEVGFLQWTYEDCGTVQYGTIDGNASYTRETKELELWQRTIKYFADLEYSGRSQGDCTAYTTLYQNLDQPGPRPELPATCPHPVREWWAELGI